MIPTDVDSAAMEKVEGFHHTQTSATTPKLPDRDRRRKSTSQRNNNCPPAAPVPRYGLQRGVHDEIPSSRMAFLYALLDKTRRRLEFLGQILVSVAERVTTTRRIGFFHWIILAGEADM